MCMQYLIILFLSYGLLLLLIQSPNYVQYYHVTDAKIDQVFAP